MTKSNWEKTVEETMRSACAGPVNQLGPHDAKTISQAFAGFTPQQMAEWHMVHFGLESSTAVVLQALLKENKLLAGKLEATTRLLKIYEEGEATYRSLYYRDRLDDIELKRLREENQSEKDMNNNLTQEIDGLELRVKELIEQQDRKTRDNGRI